MKIRQRCLLAMVLAAVGPGREAHSDAPADAPTRVAPIYSLPPEGAWVEYDFRYRDRRDKEIDGKMRISSVGQKRDAEDAVSRWIEVSMKDNAVETRLGKFLLSEKTFAKGLPLEESVLEAYHQEGAKGPVIVLEGSQIYEYFTMGIRGDLALIKDKVEIETKLGKFLGKEMAAKGKGRQRPAKLKEKDGKIEEPDAGDERGLEYRAWISDQVPFSLAKFEIWAKTGATPARLVFSAQASKRGTGAKSELDQTKAAKNR